MAADKDLHVATLSHRQAIFTEFPYGRQLRHSTNQGQRQASNAISLERSNELPVLIEQSQYNRTMCKAVAQKQQ